MVAEKRANLGRHHVALGWGSFGFISNDFDSARYGFDAANGQTGFLDYRYSFNQNLDAVASWRGWLSERYHHSGDVPVYVEGIGAGARCNANAISGFIYPYAQLSALVLREKARGWAAEPEGRNGYGLGFGAAVGLEISIGSLVSLPFEMSCLFGKPADDVFGFGLTLGASFNWGRVE